MTNFDFDYFVIGGGSGGVRSARIAATHGARVGIAEERYWGGTCVNAGCVPKKLMATAAHFSSDFRDAAGFGWTAPPASHNWTTLIERKDVEISRLNAAYRGMLTESGCTLFDARAVFVDEHTLKVGTATVTADKILVAVGAWPVLPNEPGVQEYAFTSNDVFHLKKMPSRVLIVGGGYIGMEFAGIFHGLGAQVTSVCRNDLLLREFDTDLGAHLAKEMRENGITVHLGTDVLRIDKVDDHLVGTIDGQGTVDVDCVMYAAGRKPNTQALGADAAGIACDAELAIIVDDNYRTNVPNIYAIGDVTDRLSLTPTAIAEGHALADTLFGNFPRTPSYDNVPSAVFSDPPIGAVGLSEEAARSRHAKVDVYRTSFRPLRNAVSGRRERTLMKLVVDAETDKVLGCHMIGMDAPEIIQGFAVALNCGATKAQFDATLGVHPTSAEEFLTMRTKA